VLPVKAIEKALKGHLPARHQKLLPANIEAIQRGSKI